MKAPVDVLHRNSFGRLLERIWLSGTEAFSFMDLYFLQGKGEFPEIYGAWSFGQEDLRRYILKFSDLCALHTEVEYVLHNPGRKSEIELPIYESRCLPKITAWDEETLITLQTHGTELNIRVDSHPLASAEYRLPSGELFLRYLRDIQRRWCAAYPAFPFNDCWFLPLGGTYSVFNGEKEIALLDAETIFELIEIIQNWDGEDLKVRHASGSLQLSGDQCIVTLLSEKFEVEILDLEALLVFVQDRFFISEPGSFANWKAGYENP